MSNPKNYWRQRKPPSGTKVDLQSPLAKVLVGAWPLNEGGGNVVCDVIGGNNGTLSGGAYWGQGPYGPSVYCSGGGTLILPLPAVSTSGSFSLVINHFPTTWPGAFTTLLDDSSRHWSYFINTGGANSYNGSMLTVSQTSTATAGKLWQSAFCRGAGFENVYLNGVPGGLSDPNTATTSAISVNFGSNPSGGGSNYNGYYDSILFFNRALTAGELQLLHQYPFSWVRGRSPFTPFGVTGASSVAQVWPYASSEMTGGFQNMGM